VFISSTNRPLNSRENNFDLVRLTLALIVVLDHLHYISGVPEYSVFHKWLSASFAVKGFFAVSGYLVAISYTNSKSLFDFGERRVRRIFPAYMLVVVLSVIAGAIFTSLPLDQFVANSKVWKYLASNVVFLNFLQPTLPGVYSSHGVPAMNPSLWTIKIELCLYLCIPLIVWSIKRFGAWTCAIVFYALSMLWARAFLSIATETNIWAEISRQFPGQLSYFAIGSALALAPLKNRDAYVTGLAWFFGPTILKVGVEPFFFALSVITAATVVPSLGNVGRFGDMSYGTYLYHSFLIHILHELGVFKASPIMGLVVLLALLLSMSFCSWRWLEKPLLKRTKIPSANVQSLVVGELLKKT
jgi:peptidoglycan/LPS O-acetylase OafA/YrhL